MDQGEAGENGEVEKGENGEKMAVNDIEMTSDTDSLATLPEPSKREKNKTNISRTEGHRACFDSFMTGFIFAHFIEKFGKNKDKTDLGGLDGMADFKNKVALGGKDFPLNVVQSSFTKTSKEHNERLEKIRSGT